ncbi:hypothetical protein CEXT_687281 [Caerostris extrusa]|uniref:Uncharacterized protein n=1 Tax=Caerostris extrusa TaxID=172846 RepID=A0AAV4V5P7_CAEEX|nr:hypothetical protein CEXT_687281 [Caerostris extrusa]
MCAKFEEPLGACDFSDGVRSGDCWQSSPPKLQLFSQSICAIYDTFASLQWRRYQQCAHNTVTFLLDKLTDGEAISGIPLMPENYLKKVEILKDQFDHRGLGPIAERSHFFFFFEAVVVVFGTRPPTALLGWWGNIWLALQRLSPRETPSFLIPGATSPSKLLSGEAMDVYSSSESSAEKKDRDFQCRHLNFAFSGKFKRFKFYTMDLENELSNALRLDAPLNKGPVPRWQRKALENSVSSLSLNESNNDSTLINKSLNKSLKATATPKKLVFL